MRTPECCLSEVTGIELGYRDQGPRIGLVHMTGDIAGKLFRLTRGGYMMHQRAKSKALAFGLGVALLGFLMPQTPLGHMTVLLPTDVPCHMDRSTKDQEDFHIRS